MVECVTNNKDLPVLHRWLGFQGLRSGKAFGKLVQWVILDPKDMTSPDVQFE
jgi:hypothetical protein